MKQVINVIATDTSTGSVLSVDSFLIENEEQQAEVTAAAENKFTQKCESAGIDSDTIEDGLNDGYVEIDSQTAMLSIVWSNIEE